MFSIYILYSSGSDIYYVGHTDDVQRRLIEHNETSEQSYTSRHRPWTLVFTAEISEDRGLARKIENHIKRQKSRVYIEEIIKRGNISSLIKRFGGTG